LEAGRLEGQEGDCGRERRGSRGRAAGKSRPRKRPAEQELLQQVLADQNDCHQSAESRAFEDLPHDPHDRSSLKCSLIVLILCSFFVLVKRLEGITRRDLFGGASLAELSR